MITQTIKRWLHRLFARGSRNTSQNVSFTSADQMANAALSPETSSYSSLNSLPPQPGVAPLIAGNAQGDVTCSTIDEPPNHPASGSLSPLEKGNAATPGAASTQAPESAASGAALKPTPQQQLDFLNYLVRRGLVNEGFSEDSMPKQYRRTH